MRRRCAANAAAARDAYLAMRLLWIARERRRHQDMFDEPNPTTTPDWFQDQTHATATHLRAQHG